MSYLWIDQPAQLASLIDTLQSETQLAVDTEFVRTNTYFSRPGLIQIGSRQQVWLVDPTAFSEADLQPLGSVLFRPECQLLMHSAGEDLDIFVNLWGQLPANLFDTQVAASLVGHDRQMGLQRMLDELLGVALSKEETRSDWLRRPLTENQLHYAAADVQYLHQVADLLQEKLAAQGREAWLTEECTQLLDRYRYKTPDDQLYLSFGAAWKMKPFQQAALQHLAAWREQTARQKNIPKTFIAKDAVLYGLVEKRPKSRGQLAEFGMQSGQIRRWGDDLLKQLQVGLKQEAPGAPIPRPLSKGQQKEYKALRDVVANVAEAEGLPADLLASKALLVAYLNTRLAGTSAQASPFLGGWREQVLQPKLEAVDIPTNNNNKDQQDND